MKRRMFLTGSALGAAGLGVTGCSLGSGPGSLAAWANAFGASKGIDTQVLYPGREAGHMARDFKTLAAQGGAASFRGLPTLGETDVLIVGSGIAALSCAWQLNRAGKHDFLMLEGPAPLGNAAFGTHDFSPYPQGAHYLPVPGKQCMHVRDILKDLKVLVDGVDDEAPQYDERYLVHASAERVLHEGTWHEGLLPPLLAGSPEEAQWSFVQGEFARLGALRGSEGRAVFQVPVAEGAALDGAQSKELRSLDALTFSQWLDLKGATHPTLRWYFDYCCRDEYGVDASLTSAWAGVHYFCSRHGSARNAVDGAVLTWPNGLGFLANGLNHKVSASQRRYGSALHVRSMPGRAGHSNSGYVALVLGVDGKPGLIKARRVVMATPLFMARRIAPEAFVGLEDEHGLSMSPWMVANFFLNRFPQEKPGEQLSWDNVVSGSDSLGYVVATHQNIRAALPAGTVFTAYHALGQKDNTAARKHLSTASTEELLSLATRDLDQAYGNDWRKWCVAAELTIHGHAMAVPSPGFLSEPVLERARQSNLRNEGLLFAHSDLSGYSVFEEASYWGVKAARQLLG